MTVFLVDEDIITCVCAVLVVTSSTTYCLGRLVSKMTNYVLSGTLGSTTTNTGRKEERAGDGEGRGNVHNEKFFLGLELSSSS